MKPLQTLSKEVNKRIHACKDCKEKPIGWKWLVGKREVTIGDTISPPNAIETTDICTTCQGEGYVIPLEEGCEFLIENDGVDLFEFTSKKEGRQVLYWFKGSKIGMPESWVKRHTEKLGKPLTLQDILRCLRSGTELETDRTRIIIHGEEIVELPFTDPKEWDDKTIKALIKLIK